MLCLTIGQIHPSPHVYVGCVCQAEAGPPYCRLILVSSQNWRAPYASDSWLWSGVECWKSERYKRKRAHVCSCLSRGRVFPFSGTNSNCLKIIIFFTVTILSNRYIC